MSENSDLSTGTSSREVIFEGPRLTFILLAMIIPFYIIGDRLFHIIWVHRITGVFNVYPMVDKGGFNCPGHHCS